MRTLNPATTPLDPADASARRWLHPLIFETLVAPDATAGLRPLLAVSWHSNPGATQWQFRLRHGVTLHDGTPLDAGRVAAALRAPERPWTVTGEAGIVTIDVESAAPDLPWLLAESRYAIAFGRPGGGEPIGTGPFAIDRWEPRRLTLRSHEDHWAGRAFLDAIRIEMGRPLADQLSSLELGRADLVSVQPQDARRVSQRGLRVAATRPIELVMLVFEGRAAAAASRGMRRALSLAVDRASLCDVLLQGQGTPASTLLPDWLSGYAALLAAGHDRALARAAVETIPPAERALTVSVTESDSLLRAIAERIAVDAREVGLSIAFPEPAARTRQPADVRVTRLRLEATARARALAAATMALGPQARLAVDLRLPPFDAPLEEVYGYERALLQQDSIVPLVHIPELYGAGSNVDTWRDGMVLPDGAWNLANVWLRPAPP